MGCVCYCTWISSASNPAGQGARASWRAECTGLAATRAVRLTFCRRLLRMVSATEHGPVLFRPACSYVALCTGCATRFDLHAACIGIGSCGQPPDPRFWLWAVTANDCSTSSQQGRPLAEVD